LKFLNGEINDELNCPLKQTTLQWGIAGCDPLPSKGRGEPFERVKRKIWIEKLFVKNQILFTDLIHNLSDSIKL
jgi:hypothetical protein